MNIVKHLKVYVRLNWADGDPQGSELFSALEHLEAKNLQLGNGEEARGGLPGKVGMVFSDAFHQGIL